MEPDIQEEKVDAERYDGAPIHQSTSEKHAANMAAEEGDPKTAETLAASLQKSLQGLGNVGRPASEATNSDTFPRSKTFPNNEQVPQEESLAVDPQGLANEISESFCVPSDAISMILSEDDESIKDIQSTTGCKLSISHASGADIEREIGFSGSSQAIEDAKKAIWDKIEPEKRGSLGSLWLLSRPWAMKRELPHDVEQPKRKYSAEKTQRESEPHAETKTKREVAHMVVVTGHSSENAEAETSASKPPGRTNHPEGHRTSRSYSKVEVEIPADYDEDDVDLDSDDEAIVRQAWKSLRARREMKEEERIEALRQKAEEEEAQRQDQEQEQEWQTSLPHLGAAENASLIQSLEYGEAEVPDSIHDYPQEHEVN